MKTHRFELGKYRPRESDESGNIYIDWPAIHRQAGLDCIQWLRAQDPTQCQMVIEQQSNDNYWRVIAEIHSDKLATLYSLMWTK
jgi:hypothetical protein